MLRIPSMLRIAAVAGCLCAVPLMESGAQPAAAAKKPALKLKIGKSYTVLTKNGKVYAGKLSAMNARSITLMTGKGGKKTVIPRKDIEQIREVPARKNAVVQRRPPNRNPKPAATRDPRDVDPDNPTERLLVFSPKGPFVVELDIYLQGKPYRRAREAIVDEVIRHADRNKDGKATWDEAFQSGPLRSSRFRGAVGNAGIRAAYVRRYDLNGDGLADRYEVRRLLAQLGYGEPFNVRPGYNYRPRPDVKKLLDTDKDGAISAKEIQAAAQRLKSRDANDNDLVEIAELTGAVNRRGVVLTRGGVRLPTTSRDVALLGPTADLPTIDSMLKSRYGNKDGELLAAAFQIDPDLFRKLDLNGNGKVDKGESIGLHLVRPKITLEIRIGEADKAGVGVAVKSAPKGFELSPADAKRPVEDLTVSLPGWKLRFHVPDRKPYRYDYSRTAQAYLVRYDADKNGYLDAKDVKQLGNLGRSLKAQIEQYDADGDGKVYAKEIKEFFERQLAPSLAQVTLAAANQGPSLFAAIDETGDQRISLREMRTAAKRLMTLDRNRNGRLDPVEMPGETVLTFVQGRSTGYRARRSGARRAATARGPKWFVHMDRNADGDVTLREFLGTREQFRKLDANHDGFIERKEAEAAARQGRAQQ